MSRGPGGAEPPGIQLREGLASLARDARNLPQSSSGKVLGIAATLVTHPHYLTADRLVLRDGRRVVLTIPRDRIAAVRLDRRYHDGRTVQRDGDELRIVVGNQTDVLLQLSEPVDGIRRVRFRVDEPTVLLAAVPGAGAREQSPR